MPRLLPDLAPLRRSRDLRLLVAGGFVSDLGTQAALVALPFQLFLITRSATLVGVLGAVELGPLIVMSLYGGALADRMDRRRLLLISQLGVLAGCGGLAAAAIVGHPSLAVLYPLAGLLAGSNALETTASSAMFPALVGERRELGAALAANYSLSSLANVLGPGLGGILIAAAGVRAAYLVDALSCLGVVLATLPIAAQPVIGALGDESIRRSIADGLGYVRGNRALLGSFALDLVAMTFGMPRALFAVLSVSVYHTGAGGAGLLYASVAVGSTVAAALTGWTRHARRLGVICLWAVAVWAGAIALAGAAGSLETAAALLALAGAADSVSAVCRSTINQTVTPERMRGRMSAVFGIVVTSGPRLGDIESGSVAGVSGARFAVLSGGLACLVGVGVVALACPSLIAYDSERWLSDTEGSRRVA